MTATEHLADEPVEHAGSLHPQAAAELAQELALVSNALFAQLFPGAAMRAIAGVAGVGGVAGVDDQVAPATGDVTPEYVVPVDARTAAPSMSGPAPVETPASIALPTAAAAETTVPETPVATAPVAVPGIAITPVQPPAVDSRPTAASAAADVSDAPTQAIPSIPVAIPVPATSGHGPATPAVGDPSEAPQEPAAPHRPEHVSLAMLEEIGFLDE